MPQPLQPLVSFAIHCHNHEKHIGETLDSCLAQTYRNIEVIVVDDASTDGSRQIIEDYVRRYPQLIRADYNEPPLGQALTVRKAVGMTQGEYIAGIGADDISLPHRISAGLDVLCSNPSLGAVFSRVDLIDGDGKALSSTLGQQFNAQYDNLRWQLLSGNCLCGSTVLARGELIRRHRPNSALRYAEDFDLWLGIMDDHELFRSDDIWVKCRRHERAPSVLTTEAAPLALHYESAICIIRALQRWPIGKLFQLQTSADTPEREGELAQCHARLAEHCLHMDAVCFGRPYLYTLEAYRQLVVACEHDPDNELAGRLLHEAWRRLGDIDRAAGDPPTPFVQWKQNPSFSLTPAVAPLDEAVVTFRAWQTKRAFHEIDGEHLARRMHRQWFVKPRFTLLLDGSDVAAAEKTLASLGTQFYDRWHVVLHGSPPIPTTDRISVVTTGTPPTTSLEALGHVTSEDWTILLPAGTQLEAHTLYALADHINLKPQWQAIYADDVTPGGMPRFKPDFDPVRLAGGDYLGPLTVAAPVLKALAPDVPLSLGLGFAVVWQLAGTLGDAGIGHIADVLYVLDPQPLPLDLVRACAEAYLGLSGCTAYQVDAPLTGANWLLPDSPAQHTVALLGTDDALHTLPSTTDYLLQATRLAAPTPAALARAISSTVSDLILVAFGRFQPTDRAWLPMLVATLTGWKASAVAPAILDHESRIESAGLALGVGGSLGAVLPGTPFGQAGDSLLRSVLPHRVAAMDSNLLLISRPALMAAGGLDSSYETITACLGDACLRLSAAGRSMVWTPLVQMLRTSSSSIPGGEHPSRFLQRWLPSLAADPWWNRNLSLQNGSGHAETDLVARWHPERRDSLRVLAMPLAPSGQAEYRVTAPLRALDQAGLVQATEACVPVNGHGRSPMPVEITRLAPDIIYAQAIIDDIRLQGYVANASFNSSIFRIFSLDDRVTDIPHYNDAHKALPRHAVLERMALALANSDRLIVSTRPLADLYAGQIDDIRVVPNRLEKAPWADLASSSRAARKSDKPRVGWAGAIQHAGDLAIIAPVIKELADEVDWVFFGMIPAGCEEFIAEFHPPVKPFSAYPAKLASLDLDLALAPLEINPFNEAKSNLRLLEYGILGWPVIASDIFPYREDNAPVCCVPNTVDAWLSAIREHLADRQALRAKGKALERWVREGYLLEDHLDDWLSALTPSTKVKSSRPETGTPSPLFSAEDLQDIQGGWNPEQRDGKPRILAYSQTTLLHDYRAASPLRALREFGMARTLLFGKLGSNTVSCLTSKEIEQLAPDATYWNFIIDDLRLSEGLQRCARDFPALRRVYALDDRIGNLPSTHPMAGMFPGQTLDTRIRQALSLCQRLIVTTPPLAELYGSLVDSVHIVPNRLEKALWRNIMPPQRREERRKLRVGWAGAQQHEGDLALIAQTVAELADEVDWIFFGLLPAGCEQHVREFHPAVPFIDYPAKLASLDLDIALAPLEINLFNEAKSNLRLLDYGYLGWPVICTDILPYRENTPPVIRVANTPAAWTQAIRDLVADAALRQTLGSRLRQWVHTDYLLEDHLDEWKTALIG